MILADDAPFIREVVRQLVTPRGFVIVAEAEDGNAAVELALKHRPDVVLMDLVMPIKSGIAATREILEAWPEAKIIGFSTLHQENLVSAAMEAGCVRFVQKPFEGEALIQVLKEISEV